MIVFAVCSNKNIWYGTDWHRLAMNGVENKENVSKTKQKFSIQNEEMDLHLSLLQEALLTEPRTSETSSGGLEDTALSRLCPRNKMFIVFLVV